MRNYGQHNALLCGIRAAKYDLVVTMDDDLQHPPEEIPRLLARLEEGFDVVYGAPKAEQNGLMRALASRITRLALSAAVGSDVAKNVSAFRAFPTQLREAFAAYQSPFVSIDVLLTWATTRFGATAVAFQPRHSGASNYTFTKLVRHAFDMMTFELHVHKTGSPRVRHDDRFQHGTAAACQSDWLYMHAIWACRFHLRFCPLLP